MFESSLGSLQLMRGIALNPAPDRADTALVRQDGRYFYISGTSYCLLSLLQHGPVSPSDLPARLHGAGCFDSVERLVAIIKRLEELQVVTFENATKPSPAKVSLRSRLLGLHDGSDHQYLTIQIKLLPSQAVMLLCRPLSILCGPRSLRNVLPVLIAAQAAFCWKWGVVAVSGLQHTSASQLSLLIVLNYAFLLFHECGHAAACISESVKPGEIGVGLYLYMPVFYTDVSSAWEVPRLRRIVIDASGIYFSMLASTIASILFIYTRNSIWGVLAVATDIATLANLNPAIRMDAYWLMSDWLGVENLMQMNKETAKSIINRARGRRVAVSLSCPVEGWKLQVYQLYFGIVMLFTIYTVLFFACVGIPAEVHYVAHQAPIMAAQAHHLPSEIIPLAMEALKMLLASIPILASTWIIIRTGLRQIVPVHKGGSQ